MDPVVGTLRINGELLTIRQAPDPDNSITWESGDGTVGGCLDSLIDLLTEECYPNTEASS